MTHSVLFQASCFITPKWYLFKNTPLGNIYDTISWEQLADCLPQENNGPGAPRWFSAQRMFSLMFLKSYLNISDEPTDVKLLWESCQWAYEKQLFRRCKILGIKRPRSKYVDQRRRQQDYDRRRSKPHKLG